MVSACALQRLRRERQAERLNALQTQVRQQHCEQGPADAWVALFGSMARDDWDGFSDVDLLVVAGRDHDAQGLAASLLNASLADDVLALDRATWLRRVATSPYWRAVAGEARTLSGTKP